MHSAQESTTDDRRRIEIIRDPTAQMKRTTMRLRALFRIECVERCTIKCHSSETAVRKAVCNPVDGSQGRFDS